MSGAVTTEGDFCFSAMAGEFPGAPSTDALWHLLSQGQIAPIHSMLTRWELNKASIYSAKAGEKDRTYLDSAFCLTDDTSTPSRHEGRQVAIGKKVLQTLLAQLSGQGSALIKERTALVVATSWSDESYFATGMSAKADATTGSSSQGYTPGEQVAELAAAFAFGGPALSVDTACSSFPYAIDMAQALVKSGQADNAIVMALNTVLPPALFLGFSQLTAFSSRAQMQAFGQDADGIVPGECAVAFLVEPLSQALIAQRRPLGVLRALGLSADGAEGSVFAPGKQAQFTAYQRAYVGLDPNDVDYIETHGTGTPLGDATELGSLNSFFAPHRTDGKKITIGSIKSVIGHPLAAAGGASLAKALMILRHKGIPPQPAYRPSAKVDETCLQLATEQVQPLADRQSAIRIGISSFGFGGANAHLVVDEYIPDNRPVVPVAVPLAAPGVLMLDLAIVEAEAAIGSHCSLQSFKQQLHQPAAPSVIFPYGRFVDYTAAPTQPLLGKFLAQDRVIDIDGFGMGPKPLAHVDPFKLLITDRVNHLLRRLPAGVAGSSGTAMVMCCNMGGERFSNAYSSAHNFYGQAQGMPPGVEVTDVATMLPNMLSGYPAQIFDFKGFHQTLVGTPGLFWQTLLASQQWFKEGITTLLLGAGRFISAEIEIERARHSATVQGEGLGLIALRPYQPDSSDKPLLVIRAAVLAHAANSLDEACQLLGKERRHYQNIEVCELRPDAAHASGSLQEMTGFLAEASGIETLLAVMLGTSAHTVIEVREAGKAVMWLFTEKLQEWSPAAEPAPAIKHPFTLRFAHSAPHELQQVIAPARPVNLVREPQQDGVDVLQLSDTLTNTLLSGLRVRVRAMESLFALHRGAEVQRPAHWQRCPENIVIANVQRSPQALQAQLVVNEAHPYFFDHPLDHIPGILLLEGVLQLIELAMPPLSGRVAYVKTLTIKFQQYVQKQGVIDLHLEQGKDPQVFNAKVMQAGKLMCTCILGMAYSSAFETSPAGEFTATRCRDKALLHKAREENVIVSDMSGIAQGLSVDTLKLPQEHFFQEGDPEHYSMVYFLEVARQCYMQIAHSYLRIPLNTPMNLLALSFTLDRPIPRNSPLSLAPQAGFDAQHQPFKTNRIYIDLFNRGEKIGQASITAQVLSRSAPAA
ncbi:beta-ketoacyl synthase N-terminal-like domain-containing protein [Pseudomonas cucumis]|uniref:Beta-ketoacyl synthase N-terminal-like domain-containing protein n=1 Tax=Pseudomonas cucumis TaxID=2954082 RepID=A0ABY9F3F5_9PSED|nr:beta-ketoacyl synthase N-terminal-like domain-containing protein [Pseudomonas cucumis]WLG87439.1 beta-ketoacyl synthase N-terminal-like domain-containing protein [Pseudomonas cucumis]